ncbi:NfeD family protein [Martelella alba]|uniref:NfeD family protein n=2 Tax=Martelella alba TaxID=2590451 RepID=A0ABY2SMN0_9HYPH|nr:NfeD family protein [Martelella alba]
MLAAIMSYPHGFWITLGGALLAAEMLGAGGYLLWSGIAAVLVGLLSWVLPLDWAWQGVFFSLLTVASAVAWWYWLRGRDKNAAQSLLNQRGAQLVGTHAILIEPVVNGIGRVRVGDGTWRAVSDTDLAAGCSVVVIAAEGVTLRVRPL